MVQAATVQADETNADIVVVERNANENVYFINCFEGMSAQTWRSAHGGGHRVAPTATDSAKSATDHIRQYLEKANAQEDKNHYQFPFSWFRFFISLVSYIFYLSDVLRTGPGVSDLRRLYSTLEPGYVSYFGPYKYVVVHLTTANSTADDTGIPYWPYKYDSTSLVMRSLARHLLLPAWSPCVLYEAACDETQGLARSSVFAMIDSIIDGVRDYPSTCSGQQITLRATTNMYDALYHYALPWFFQHKLFRTHQAIYYDHTRVHSRTRSFCGRERTHPNSCNSVWTQLHRYGGANTYPRETVWANIEHRIARLKEAYPNKTLDLVILDGIEDYRPGGYAHQGTRGLEVVTLARIQDCGYDPSKPSECVTVAVDDYRQESGIVGTNVTSWFPLIASLRIIGQMYAWLRLGSLFAGCIATHAQDQRLGYAWYKTVWHAVFFIPSQVVVYGSHFPIVCYAVAHLLDSPFVYIRLENLFIAQLGEMTLTVGEMLLISAVAMRSVWLLAVICHLVIAVSTRRSWSPLKQAPGTPRFLIVVVAAANIVSAVRLLRLRNSKVVQIDEVVPSERRLLLQSLRHHLTRGHVSSLTVGVRVDARTVSCAILLVLAGVALFRVVGRACTRRDRYRASVISRTLVPYSAASLWSTNTFVVCWHAMCEQQDQSRSGASIMSNDSIRGQDGNWKVWMANLVAMTDPVTFLQLRGLRGQLLGLYVVKQTGRRVLLPLVWATSHANTELAWDELKLLAVVSTKEVEWAALLRCG